MGVNIPPFNMDLPTPKKKPIHCGTRNHRHVCLGWEIIDGRNQRIWWFLSPEITALPSSQELGLFDWYITSYQVSHFTTTAYSVPGMIPVCCTRHPPPTTKNHTQTLQQQQTAVCETELRPHTNATAAPPPHQHHTSTTTAPQQQRQQQRRWRPNVAVDSVHARFPKKGPKGKQDLPIQNIITF